MRNATVKITIRPLRAKHLEGKVSTARYARYLSHVNGGGKTSVSGAFTTEYKGTPEADEAYKALHLEWTKVWNGPLVKIAYV